MAKFNDHTWKKKFVKNDSGCAGGVMIRSTE